MSVVLSLNAFKFDPNCPLPTDLPDTNARKTSRAGVVRLAQDEGLTVCQLARRYGGY